MGADSNIHTTSHRVMRPDGIRAELFIHGSVSVETDEESQMRSRRESMTFKTITLQPDAESAFGYFLFMAYYSFFKYIFDKAGNDRGHSGGLLILRISRGNILLGLRGVTYGE
jgi:hypothetical protein